jgi:LAO/AO transport system kinase
VSGLLERFFRGDRHALARLLTNIENETELGEQAIHALADRAGRSHLIGLTGPPGAGKSTLANAIVKHVRKSGLTIAVVAIDPTSPFSGGATLGDRIRMLESYDDDGVFIRSMASRGQIGGLTLAAFGASIVLDAFGFDVVLIETVGAGQDEVDVARLADSVILVQTPGMGDSIQAVKAGILEICDILVVNKADQPGADEVVRDLREQVRTGHTEGWRIPVIPVIATEDSGIDGLMAELTKHRDFANELNTMERRREARLHQQAKMLAIRQLSQFLNGSFETVEQHSSPSNRANEMIRSFIRSYRES